MTLPEENSPSYSDCPGMLDGRRYRRGARKLFNVYDPRVLLMTAATGMYLLISICLLCPYSVFSLQYKPCNPFNTIFNEFNNNKRIQMTVLSVFEGPKAMSPWYSTTPLPTRSNSAPNKLDNINVALRYTLRQWTTNFVLFYRQSRATSAVQKIWPSLHRRQFLF